MRATGHTASDNVETVLYRLASSGRPAGIKPKREDGVVGPLLTVWGEETKAYCDGAGLPYRTDSTNVDTKRGLIRYELLPLLERLDPRARANLLALAEQPAERRLPRTLERTLLDLLSTTDGTKEADLGRDIHAVREYDRLTLERGPVRFGPWTIESASPGLEVRTWQPGDRLAGRSRKVRTSSPTRRCRDASVRPGRSSFARTSCLDPGIVDNPEVRVSAHRDHLRARAWRR